MAQVVAVFFQVEVELVYMEQWAVAAEAVVCLEFERRLWWRAAAEALALVGVLAEGLAVAWKLAVDEAAGEAVDGAVALAEGSGSVANRSPLHQVFGLVLMVVGLGWALGEVPDLSAQGQVLVQVLDPVRSVMVLALALVVDLVQVLLEMVLLALELVLARLAGVWTLAEPHPGRVQRQPCLNANI